MIILLCGEGKNDVGVKKYGTDEWEEGTVQTWIRNILADKYTDLNLKFQCVERKDAERISLGKRSLTGLNGHGILAYKLIRYAQEHNIQYDIVGMYKDTDRKAGAKNTKKEAINKHNEVIEDIHNGFLMAKKDDIRNNYFAIVPIRILENWLIADKSALDAQINRGGNANYKYKATYPEEIWGEHNDSDSDYPKYYLERILRILNAPISTDTYRAIAEAENLSVMRKKCKSFDEFYNELINVIDNIL